MRQLCYVDEYGNAIPVGLNDLPSDSNDMFGTLDQAFRADGGGFRSDIAALAQFARLQMEQRQAEGIQAVDINPASVLRNSDPKLGDQATVIGVALASSGGSLARVVEWDGRTCESRACTVSIGIPQIGTDGSFSMQPIPNSGSGTVPAGIARPYAIINYGTRNYMKQVVVDVGKGVTFTVTASRATVDVGLELSSGGTVGAMLLGGSLGFYTVSRTTPMSRTIYVSFAGSNVKANNTQSYIIPASAKRLLPVQRTFSGNAVASPSGGSTVAVVPTPVPIQLDFFDNQSNLIFSLYGGDTVYSFMSGPLDLPNDAYKFTISNMDSSNPSAAFTARLPFEIVP